MRENWDRAISSVLLWEGGFAQRENEPGGAVNMGVSLMAYREIHPGATVQDLKNMPVDEAKQIFKGHYADRVYFDDCPGGLDVVLLHVAVMQGVGGAIRLFQSSLGVPDALLDNRMSPTIFDGVVRPLEAARGLIIRCMRAKMHDKNVVRFGPGWSDRYVAIDQIAKELAGGA
jgi:lysozyme family protein